MSKAIELDLRLSYDEAFSLAVESTLPGTGISGIFGASGSGKTTLLRCLAGLQTGVGGRINVNGETWQDTEFSVPAHRRPIGYVFQEANLFPHLTAGENLDYARKRADGNGAALADRDLLRLLAIGPLLDRKPAALSGGERQRVAIARALLIRPQLLLMDEPLAALDGPRKQEILPYLEALHQELDIPVLYVTHSLEELSRLADHVLVLERGRVAEQGPLTEVLSRLDSRLQAGDDSGAVLSGHVRERDSQWHLAKVAFPGGELWVKDTGDVEGESLRLRILARDVSISLNEDTRSSIVNRLPCQVLEMADDRDAAMTSLSLRVGDAVAGSTLVARVSRRSVHELALAPGMPVWAQIKSVAILR